MFCTNCGAKLEDSAVFCGECGTKVEVVATATVEETKEAVETKVEEVKEAVEAKVEETKEAVEAKVEETKEAVEAKVEETKKVAEAVVAEAVAPVEKAVEEAPAPEKKKGGKGGLVALIIVVVLLLAGGGAAAWYFTSDGYNCKKNLKQAEEAFAAGELEDAKDYYETVLEYDETQKDIYIKLADISIQEGKYESAIKTLKKGIKNTEDVEGAKEELTTKLEAAYIAAVDDKVKAASYKEALSMLDEAIAAVNTPALVQKKKDIYMNQVTDMMEQQNYWDALDIAHKGFDATADKDFQEKIADAYIAMAEQEAEYGNYSYALGLVEEALYDVDSQKLKDAKLTLYKRWIDSDIEAGDYSMAVYRTRQAYDETGDETFKDKEIDTYLEWADVLVANGYYSEALDALEEGVYYTQSEKLSAKIEEINNAEVLLSKQVINNNTGTSVVYEYNEKGQDTRITNIDEYGNITQVIVYEYDEEGNISEYRTYDGSDELLVSIIYEWTVVDGKKQCAITYLTYVDGVEYLVGQETCDENHNPLSYTEYNEDGTAAVLKQYEYDEAGNLVKEMIVVGEEMLVNQYAYTYDEAGNMLESVSLDEEGIPFIQKTYDEKGNVLEYIEYGAEGEVVSTEQSTYDANGNQLTYQIVSEESNYHSESVYEGDELIQYTYTDDTTGEVIVTEYTTTKDGNVVTKESAYYLNTEYIGSEKLVSEYDEEGRLLHAELFDMDGMSIGSDHIEYDEKGNEIYAFMGISGEGEEYITNYEYGFPQ